SAPLFTLTLILFWLTAFASSTHDIAADGFYMLALEGGVQSLFVGIRSLFYRLSSVFGQGVLVVIAGILETRTGNIPLAWALTLAIAALLFAALTVYHAFFLPRPASDSLRTPNQTTNGTTNQPANTDEYTTNATPTADTPSQTATFSARSKEIFKEFGRTFATFFRKKGVVLALVFLLLYRLPEALLLKMLNPFLLDPVSQGGLGLTTETVGIVYGTIGVIALILGGILGGVAASRWGLKKSLLPMALCIALPCLVYLYMSLAQPSNLLIISTCVALDQFGYGFGFTAYMLYMMYYSEGEFKTAHYSLCTAFMALSMMLPGLAAGYLEERLGYTGFFVLVAICCLVTIAVTFCVKVAPEYGKLQRPTAPEQQSKHHTKYNE
ncbi:MAG: MFS transporter, partial [Bacteroidales bacterium]|nr:MFS transporter [Bacteroidales bacterium]